MQLTSVRQSTGRSEGLVAEARRIVRERSIGHVGFIVDGNRRWATRHGLEPVDGHRRALEVLLDRVKDAAEFGIPVVSFWLFSTENWRRPPEQVDAMFELGREIKDRLRGDLMALNARFRHIGRKVKESPDQKTLPDDLRAILAELERETASNVGILTLGAINYGGRDEVIRAANAVLKANAERKAGEIEFTPEVLAEHLDTRGIPDPDLVIRTSGEVRTSGFMTWQAAYSEWIFTRTYFPAFSRTRFVQALREFNKRQRRFGGG